ncbi:hypothetical protein [Candidatus Spyradosoma sp. SGI.093]|uniref:LPD3 domain-containing protein n=1 Tax=Candidatus Spyradosoma sp. SGI.093 TaxID=3420583 RepID=UPI003D001184
MTNEELIREWQEGKRLAAVKLDEADTPEAEARKMEGARRRAAAEFELLRRESEEIDALVQKWLADLRAGKNPDWRGIEPEFQEIWKRYARMFGYVKDGVEMYHTLGDFKLTISLMGALQDLVNVPRTEKEKAYAEEDFKESYEKFRAWHAEKSKLVDAHERKLGRERAVSRDTQGNPVDERGALIFDNIEKMEDLSDADFTNPSRSIALPALPQNVSDAIGSGGKRVVIKKNVFEKNARAHAELSPEASRAILKSALYSTDIVGQTRAITRPNYWVAISTKDKNSVVVLEVNRGKENTEIVGWRLVDSRGLEKMKRQAQREDGQLLILTSEKEAAAALSALPSNLPTPRDASENGSEVKPIFDEKGKVSFGGSAAVSVTEDKWGIYRAYADEAGEKHKFPSAYPSFRELLVRVAKKRGVAAEEVFREASERLTRAMQEADNGQRATDSGNASGGFSGENGRGSEYSSGNPAGTRNAWSARTPSAENSVVVSGEYRVVDADELTFVDVSDKAQQDEQERNREGRRTKLQTHGMLEDFVAERLLEDAHTDRGAPIYRELEDGTLRSVSGEGRSRLLKDVYEWGGEPEAQYRAALEKFAREHGVAVPEGVRKPVLVRVAKDAGGMSWAALAKASNMDMKSAYSTAERAHADARELGKCLPLLNARSEDDLLGEKNHAFVVAFVQAVNAGTEYVQDRKEGFKETLATRIQEALVAYVIGDREAATDLFDSPYSLKNALNTLMDLAVDLARLKENERYDVSRELAAALKAALAVRELKRKGDARTTEQLIETHFEGNALEGIGENVRAGLDLGAAKMLANLMLDRKTGLFGRTLIGYVSEVERENGLEGNDMGLFGAETDWGSKSELMKRALDKANGEKNARYSLSEQDAETIEERRRLFEAATPKMIARRNAEVNEELLKLKDVEIENAETGIRAKIAKNQRDKLVSNKAAAKSEANGFTREQHNTAAANIADLFRRAYLFEERGDADGDPNLKSIRRFAALIVFNGVPAEADILVKEGTSYGSRIYTVELQEIKKPSARGTESINADNGKTQGTPPTTDGKEKVAQEAEKVNAYLESRRKYSLAGYEAEQSGLARKYSIDAETASLVGLHEISEEKLRKAIALGGLANPSLGVVDLNARAGTGFGAITLIAPRTLIDKKTGRNAGTYAGDAWTPMVPPVKLIGNEKTMKAADVYIDGRVGNPEIAQHVKTDTRAILSGRGNNQYLRYVFLKERGIPVPERVTPIHFPEGTALKVIDILGNESFFAFESELSDAQKRALTDLYFEVSEKPDASEKIKNVLKKMLTDEKGLLNYNVIRDFLARARSDYREGGKLDAVGTVSDAVREVSAMRLEDEYVQWRDELLKSFGAREQIYAGETRTGRSRYIDATLENISKEMNKKAVKDSGDDTNFGSIKASLLKSMTSLKQIRSKKELLNLSDADAEAAVEETKDRLVGVFNAINAKKKLVENPFMNFDYSVRRLKEAFAEEDPKSYLENEYGYEIEEKLAQELSAVKELMQNLPAKYFETKFRRPVGLDEFRAAVVPAGTDAAVVSALKDAGVSVEEYAADDAEDRAAKVRGVAAKASDVRFSLAMEASAEYLEPSDFGEDGRAKPEILAEIEAEKAKIREDAQKNGTFGKAPNGSPSNLNAEQWVLVRTKRFKRWFGDWEFARQVEQIFKMSPIHSLTGTEFQKDSVPLTEKVTAFWKEKHNGFAVNPTLGTVRLDREGVKDSLGHGIGSLKSAAYAAVPSVIEHGIIFDRQTNWKNRGYDTAVLAAPITIGGKEYICEVVVETRPNRQGFYLHEVELKEKVENAFKTPTKGSAFPTSRLILAKKAYKVNEEGVSKVVDENGEPRVVYHQTGDDFTAFDTNARKNSAGDSEMPVGVFLKPDDRDIGLRGKKQMGLFAKASNIKRFKNRAEVREFVRNNEAYDSAQKTIHSNDVQFGKEFEEVEKKIDALYSSLWHMRGSIKISENKEYQALQEKSSAILKKWTNANDALGEKARNILTGELKRLGFDGVYVDEDSGSFGRKTATYVVFNPAGVKSATENVGTYARENPDIRYSLGQQYFNFEGTEGLPLFDAMREQVESAEDVAKLDEAERALKRRVDMEPWRAKSDALKNSTAFIANTFGFKKVNVGKRKGEAWTTPKEVYDALLDLAEIVDVPPSAVGFGDLDLDVSGRATTRRKGTYIHGGDHKIHVYDHGSLAHEWMHALHDWFGGLSQAWRDNRYETRRSLPMGDPVRAEIADAFKAIEDAVEKSDFARRSREAEKGAAYLSKNIELVARAFETYVLSRVKNGSEAISRVRELNDAISEKRNEFLKSEEAERQRVRSELLALKTELDKVGRNLLVKFDDRMMRAYYPTIEELDADGVSAAFDRLFSTLKWKETDENGRKVSRLYSISMEEQDAWNGVLDAYEAGKLRGDAEYKVLERVPTVWKACGIDDLPIVISGNALNKITKEKHGIAVGDLRDLLTNIDDPMAVFTSKTRPEDSVVVLVEIMDANTGEKSVVSVAVDQSSQERGKRVNKITSIYGRPARQILGFMNDGLALYVNQQKSRAYLRSNRLQLPAAASKRGNPSLLTEEDFSNDALGEVIGKRKFSLSEMEESEETIRARARERARERAKQERAKKKRDAYGSLKDIGAESRRMIQDFIREHNELYSDPAAIRKLKVKGIALAKLLLERGLDKADAALLDAVCGGEPEMLRRDVKARGELLARLMRENLDNTAAVKATVAQITAMSNRIGRMRAYARLSSMLSFGSAEAYDALDAIERERRARDDAMPQ